MKIIMQPKRFDEATNHGIQRLSKKIEEKYGQKSERKNKKKTKDSIKKSLGVAALLLIIMLLIPFWIIINLIYIISSTYIYDFSVSLNHIILSFIVYVFIMITAIFMYLISNYFVVEIFIHYMKKDIPDYLMDIIKIFDPFIKHESGKLNKKESKSKEYEYWY